MPKLEVYSRRGCHLCEILIEDLLGLAGQRAEIVVHDVDTRPDWQAQYGSRVPVVESAGEILCEYRLDRAAVTSALAAQQ